MPADDPMESYRKSQAAYGSFLTEYGLYRKYPFPGGEDRSFQSIPSPAIQLFCSSCNGERTWIELRKERCLSSTTVNEERAVKGDDDRSVGGCLVCHTFLCSSCQRQTIAFVVRFGADHKLNKRTGDPEKDALNPTTDVPYVLKVGQYPAWSIDPPKEVKIALGRHEDLYKRGTICESQGYGIGAFAYYRRIVEDMIDQLLADIAELIEPQEREKYRAALAKVRGTIVAADKIEIVKEMLPTFLRPGGINPLQTLHDALSVGIHALDEDDCLALAEGIRQSLAMLCKHIALAKQDAEEYATKITSVKERLDKIKRKSEGK